MPRFVLIFVLFLLAGMAAAQIPTSGNVFFGYSYYNTNLTGSRGSLNGWEGSLEGKIFPFIGIVADFIGEYGSLDFPVRWERVSSAWSAPLSVPAHTSRMFCSDHDSRFQSGNSGRSGKP